MQKHTLIITEKPDAAKKIAYALDKNGKPEKKQEKNLTYYIAKRNQPITIVPALGHLYTVAEAEKRKGCYPTFRYTWMPRYAVEKKAYKTRSWLEAIATLSENADTFIDACDYDIEGSIIGYNILKHACGNKERTARRMKYSTLTKEELEKSYENPLPHLDFALIEAGLTRHEVDWLYGINLSRALTLAAKKHSGKYSTFSTGRVQAPTLSFIVSREEEIGTFVPVPYWEIKAKTVIENKTFWANYAKGKIETKSEAEAIVNSCKGKNGTVEKIETETFLKPPPTPFDLGTLQSEAYRLFGYTPKRTSDIAQSLYLDALISYPRTSSQKLPPNINYRAILSALARFPAYRQPATALLQKTQLTPKEGKATDPAHPAIYPTGTLPTKTLNNAETKILDLIIRRFMAVFADPATGQNTKVSININSHPFQLNGTQISRRGWLDFYQPYAKTEETPLPPIKENQPIQIEKVVLENKYTKPPPRYTAASLLRLMEKSGIGTKATRAETIQTIYERKYAKNQNITPTILGFEVHNILEKHCRTITSPLFTRELEQKMDSIMANEQTRENIIAETISSLKPLLEKLEENEETIGAQLTQAINQMKNEERALGSCPNCKTGTLTILYSRKTGKRFVGCTNYFKGLCKTSFPLPQTGRIRKKEKPCLHCGFPTIQAITATGRAWDFCLNPKCPARRQKEGQAVEMQNM